MLSWFNDDIAEQNDRRVGEMAAVNSVSGARLGLSLRPRAVLMCGATEGVALQVACPDPATLHDLLATLHAAGAGESTTATFDLLDSSSCHDMDLSPQLPSDAFHASDTSNSPGQNEQDLGDGSANSRFASRRLRSKATSPSRQGPQQCQVCNKIFGNASALAKHKLTHSDERKYVCTMCSKAFKRQDHLNGHMLTHRNKKPYECRAEGCGKSYCDARSLRRHAENHHGAPAAAGDASSPGGSSCIQYASSSGSSCGRDKDGQGSSGDSPSPVHKDSPSSSRSSPDNALSPQQKPHKSSSESSPSNPKPSTSGLSNQPSTSQSAKPPGHQQSKQTNSHTKQSSSGQQGKPQNGQASTSQQNSPSSSGQKVTSQKASSSSSQSSSSSTSNSKSQDGAGSNSSKNTKPSSVQRPPRTWNIQAQQNQQRTSNALRSLPGGLARFPPEPRPVECNLCHRRFKNIPALNGHMRLHGGYFKKETENKKAEKKEPSGPPLQTASVSVRALIEEKIISRRAAPQVSTTEAGPSGCSGGNRSTAFVAPAPPPPATTASSNVTNTAVKKPPTPDFLPPPSTASSSHKDATLIELLKRGTKVAVRRSASDPGQQPTESMQLNFQQGEFTLTSMSFQSDDGGYFSPSLQNEVYHVQDPAILLQPTSSDSLQFSSASEQLDDLASLEDYASVTASLHNQPSMQYPVNQQLQAVLNSPLPESLAEFSTYHSTVAENNSNNKDVLGFQKEYIMYANSPHVGLSAPSPLPSPLKYHDSPSFTYPTPPASHEAQSPSISQGTMHSLPILSPTTNLQTTDSYIEPILSHSRDVDEVRNTSSPLSAAFFTTTMSSAEEVEEALEEVLPGESIVHGDTLDMYSLSNTSPPPQSPICVTPLPSPLSSTRQPNACPQTFLPTANITFPRQAIQTLQSHMMPNSDDPLLSSSPKDFGVKKKFDFGGYQSYKIISHAPIDLNNPGLTGILVESNGEYKLIQAASNQLPVSWLTANTHQIVPKDNMQHMHQMKDGIIKSANPQSNINEANEIITTLKVEVEAIKQEALSDVFLSPNSIPASPQRVSRKRPRSEASGAFFQSQHQSRLKNSEEFYTPSPMLNPVRTAPGLFNEVNPNGAPICSHQLLEAIKLENEEKKVPKINIGNRFQATIPDSRTTDETNLDREPSYEHLLWDPGINDILDDNEVKMFMELAMCAAMPVGGHSREHALQVLGQCGGDIHAATLRLMSQAQISCNGMSERWTPDEVEMFLAGLREYDKDFFKISRQIGTKNSKQCVQFYYFWKKVTKDYKGLYLRSWSPDRIGERLANQQNWSRWSNNGRAIGRSPSTPPSTPAADSGDEFPCKLCGNQKLDFADIGSRFNCSYQQLAKDIGL